MHETNYSTKHRYDVTKAGMTMEKLEHMVIDNEYAAVKPVAVSDVHLAVQEPQARTTEVVSSMNEDVTSSDTNKEIITVL